MVGVAGRFWSTGERGLGPFPRPVAEIGAKSQQWRWSEVASWLVQDETVDEDAVRDAYEIAGWNAALEARAAGGRVKVDSMIRFLRGIG